MIAMIIAFASDDIEVLAVTTSAGNQTQDKTNSNARKIMSFLGIEGVPVARGCEKPICRELRIAADVHGETGLDGADLGQPGFEPDKRHAVELMRDVLMSSRGKTAIVATGPLTNVALLLAIYPQAKEKIECISFMGGSVYGGNVTPRAEFNILVDPEAAKAVFSSGVPLIMAGLEVTHKARLGPDGIARMRAVGNRLGAAVADLMEFYMRSATQPLFAPPGHVEGAHMHDPCAVAALIAPDRFLKGEFFGDVELGGIYSAGSTVIDIHGKLGRRPNMTVAFDVDSGWLTDLIVASISRFS
jgi:pyrimidine-specific ribonucleoside hydrolase